MLALCRLFHGHVLCCLHPVRFIVDLRYCRTTVAFVTLSSRSVPFSLLCDAHLRFTPSLSCHRTVICALIGRLVSSWAKVFTDISSSFYLNFKDAYLEGRP